MGNTKINATHYFLCLLCLLGFLRSLCFSPVANIQIFYIALGEQLRAISKTLLLHFRGVLDIETMERLDRALAIALALNLKIKDE